MEPTHDAHRPPVPLLALSALTVPTVAYAAANGTTADIQMAADSAPFRAAADEFVTRAMAGDVDRTQALLSREPGGAVTVTQTTDAAGQQGFAFYMWMQYADAPTARPFAVYVVKEQGRLVVANIVPDRFVEGRHR